LVAFCIDFRVESLVTVVGNITYHFIAAAYPSRTNYL
jgi:hypothetical protein